MEGFIVVVLMAAVFIIGLIVILFEQQRKEKEKQQAQEAYRKSLELLKGSPADPEIKERTLALGRKYSNLTRDKGGVALFDEVALMNDIGAACAAAAQALPKTGGLQGSLEDRLQALETLRSNGMITDEEFQAQRLRILGDL